MRPRIAIACYEVCGYGGAATSVYSLFRKLQYDGFDIHLINIVSNSDMAIFSNHFGESIGNPDELPNVHLCTVDDQVWASHESLIHKINELMPDLMIGYGTISAYMLLKIDLRQPVIYCSVGFDQIDVYYDRGIVENLCDLSNYVVECKQAPNILHNQEAFVVERADLVIVHSDIVLELFTSFYSQFRSKLVQKPIWYFDWISQDASHYQELRKPFDQRKIDLLFIASNWERKEKNYELVKQICAASTDLEVHIVGHCLDYVDGVTHHHFISDRTFLFEILGQSRTLICPSLFDAAPGVIWEAIEMGCNVVTSKNCGNWMACHPSLLANTLAVSDFCKSTRNSLERPLPHNTRVFQNTRSYQRLSELLNDYSFGALSSSRTRPVSRLAYHLWQFPILSETFIQREISAIRRRGISPLIIAESRNETSGICDTGTYDLTNVLYLDELDPDSYSMALKKMCLSRPFRITTCYWQVLMSRYHANNSKEFNTETFRKSVVLALLLLKHNVTHVHAPWSDRNAFIAKIAARMCGVSYSAQARAHDIHRVNYAKVLKATLKGAKFVITNTDYNRNYLKKFLPAAQTQKIVRIYNGIDLAGFQASRNKVQRNDFRIISVGRITPQKGYIDLLKACSIIRDKGVKFHLDIIGEPEMDRCEDYFKQLKSLHRELALENFVKFHGAQPLIEVIKFYNNSHLFVLPCVIDSDGSRDIIPNSLIEAMAMKLPVISTCVTGVPEIIDNETNGILVEPGDYESLAQAMFELISDPEKCVRIGHAARLKVEQRFDIDENIREYVNLFLPTLNKHYQPKLQVGNRLSRKRT
ncbi:MAG: glycosyltransferase involved in cell wall biosynthesis [Gammaproteobacteria bacterium]|jgi:glycosyltransferase involved in cell wall biosynthesis